MVNKENETPVKPLNPYFLSGGDGFIPPQEKIDLNLPMEKGALATRKGANNMPEPIEINFYRCTIGN